MRPGTLGSEPPWARRLIRIVEEHTGRPSPRIEWRWQGGGECQWEEGVIRMPSQEWREYFAPDPVNTVFHQSMLLHELAHWYCQTPRPGHTKEMYALMFWMCRWTGLPMRRVLKDEIDYMPGAARAGYRLYRRQLRGDKKHHLMAA